ncbi:MAG: hypothetical protein M1586_02315 [Patescibacteria group bacterium]|nr:hypothetical protein [Patescibacteria group bacterium]MCL5262108.1 hypothetical protein [Patescibacteria group bacterium]
MIVDFPVTPTIASDFPIKVDFEVASDPSEIIYIAPDYGITSENPYRAKEVSWETHFDPQKAASGVRKLKNGQKDAPIFIFKDIFGLTGFKITCEPISPICLAGGMESSNAFNLCLLVAGSVLSGADLSYADIFNLAVKLENDEFGGSTGGQGYLSSILGGAYYHVWLSGLR